MSKLIAAAFLAAACMAAGGDAYAETIIGKVAEVNANSNFIRVDRTTDAGEPESIRLAVAPDTELRGINSLAEIEVGEEITVDADQNFLTRRWSANAIELGTDDGSAQVTARTDAKAEAEDNNMIVG